MPRQPWRRIRFHAGMVERFFEANHIKSMS
jgi:hypothetical protein